MKKYQSELNKAIKLYEQGSIKKSFEKAEKLLKIYNDNVEILKLLLLTSSALNDLKNKEKYLLKLTSISDDPVNCQSLGLFYYQNNNLSEAKKYYEKAINLDNNYIKCYLYLSLIYMLESNYDKAHDLISAAMELSKNSEKIYECYEFLAKLYEETEDYAKAYEVYKKLITHEKYNIDTLFNFSLSALRLNGYEEGFDFYRFRYHKNRQHKQKLVQGVELLDKNIDLRDKSILVLGEQGYGDVIHFLRYLPLLKAKNANVTMVVDELLIELCKKNFSDVEFTNTIGTGYDYQLPIADSGYIFNTKKESIPFSDGYLDVDRDDSKEIEKKYFSKSTKKRVGIVWRSNTSNSENEDDLLARDRNKWNIDLEDFIKYFNKDDIELYSMQVGVNNDERKILNRYNIPSIGDDFVSFYDNALVIDNLDLVISINTASALLAGAMRKDTVILLPDSSDWRWGIDGDRGLWFESIKLVRKKYDESWRSALLEASQIEELFLPVSNIDRKIGVAQRCQIQGKLDIAKELYLEVLDSDQTNHKVYNYLGVIEFNQGRLEKSIELLQHSISLKPDYIEAVENLQSIIEFIKKHS